MSESKTDEAEGGGGTRLLIDLGPLIVFFAANFFAPVPGPTKIFFATGAFMIAMIAAMVLSQIRFGKISPLLWFSGIMVVVMGGITIWLHDESFIKINPNGPSQKCSAKVFALEVLEELSAWPEMRQRKRRWFAVEKTIPRIGERQLRKLIRSFAKAVMPGKAA